MKPLKAIVFFSAGLGDALLLIPAIKRLKLKGYALTGLFNSDMPCGEMMELTGLLDETIHVKSKTAQGLKALTMTRRFDLAVLNSFAGSKKNLVSAKAMAKKVICNGSINGSSTYIAPEPGIHDAEQNLRLIGERGFKPEELSIPALPLPDFNLPADYLIIQTSSGNPSIAYKNWPQQNWKEFIQLLLDKYPDKKIILPGNETDIAFCDQLEKSASEKIISLAGKTNVVQLMQLVCNCSLLIGLDGGLMHMAAAYQKPTFTLWGPSSEILYGYEQYDAALHKCVRAQVTCSPCNAWIGANLSRVTDPNLCPDIACMQQLTVTAVFSQFSKYVTSLPSHAW